uniref:Uncharacterized protein n=1 Tax=Romanomermis culicivorax TaxID=13658 RepID=A0A915JMW0_ROMCU
MGLKRMARGDDKPKPDKYQRRDAKSPTNNNKWKNPRDANKSTKQSANKMPQFGETVSSIERSKRSSNCALGWQKEVDLRLENLEQAQKCTAIWIFNFPTDIYAMDRQTPLLEKRKMVIEFFKNCEKLPEEFVQNLDMW